MRISDWSSDVCSSDLLAGGTTYFSSTSARKRSDGMLLVPMIWSCRADSRSDRMKLLDGAPPAPPIWIRAIAVPEPDRPANAGRPRLSCMYSWPAGDERFVYRGKAERQRQKRSKIGRAKL